MYRKINGKFIKIGGKISNLLNSKLQFTVRGPSFLNWYYNATDPYAVVSASSPNGLMQITSTRPNTVTINYGDGVTEVFNFIQQGTVYYFIMQSQINQPPPSGVPVTPVMNHAFTDGNTGVDRIVTLSIQYPEYITGLTTSLVLLRGSYPADIDKFKLVSLSINYTRFLTSFPSSIFNIKTLIGLSLITPSQTLLTSFPDAFLGFVNLQNLGIGGVFDFSDPIGSGFYKIGNYGSTLQTLSIQGSRIGQTNTDLPVELLNLTGLKSLNISANLFTTTPPLINQMTSLTNLVLGGFTTETITNNWGDFRNLVNLQNLTASVMQSLPTTLPTWFNSLIKLKVFTLSGSYHTLTRINAFVDNFYDLIINTAPITGTNVNIFRSMTITIYSANIANVCPRPTGTYQQPSGYIQGSFNGDPASQMEKIWVLTNQYAHVWAVNPS